MPLTDLLFGKGVTHDIVSQRLLNGLVIPVDAVPCIHAEPAVVPVHELLNKTIGYLALAFQHGQNPGPKDLLKLLHLAPWKVFEIRSLAKHQRSKGTSKGTFVPNVPKILLGHSVCLRLLAP